jgi:ATP-dependent DNA helicase RecQ
MPELLKTLKSVWGYDAFRPFQREIIEASLAGRDVIALLPTGGGKSLCFQLPALHREGLTLVVSPLIALMKDQVDQLQAAGVAATFLNSSLKGDEARSRMAALHRGEYRLLYVAPERLLLPEWRERLPQWNVRAVVIDEAHCVSEWGHDFRPEYRRLSELREALPGVPWMALTATATGRVRDDIVRHLGLDDPVPFTASFNRPNLSYRIVPRDQPLRQIAEFLRTRSGEAGIIYCFARATADRLAAALAEKGLPALPYHAGLTAEERTANQEKFLRDEARIICGTIAFGMGINKPNVRWVIHHDLPKNIEGYYQETGRAGRDGLPSECLLLFSAADIAKQMHFIDELTDDLEKQTSRQQLQKMAHYAEGAGCRRRSLLSYFGEDYGEPNCGGCDNCLEPRETYDGTLAAQKFLSCVYRIHRAGGFGVGMNHVIEVLTGAETEKIRKWGHGSLTTYGIGKDLGRHEWAGVGRELLRLGLLAQGEGTFPTLSVTEEGFTALKEKRTITLTKPMAIPTAAKSRRSRAGSAPEIECDEGLFERLRKLRKKLADERSVPAYVVFGDTTLRHMARQYPTGLQHFRGITGMGDKKLAEFGEVFAAEIADWLKSNPRIRFQG